MCMWFGFNPAINFLSLFHFVNFVIFQFFAGATSTSPKFDLYFNFKIYSGKINNYMKILCRNDILFFEN